MAFVLALLCSLGVSSHAFTPGLSSLTRVRAPHARAHSHMSGGLIDWLRAAGATPGPIRQAPDGMLSLEREVRAGELLLSVPSKLRLSEASLRENVVGSFIDGWPMAAGEHAPIALAFLHECFLAESSPWAGYIRSLPAPGTASLDVPLLWNAAEQTELAASTTFPVSSTLEAIRADYAWLVAHPFAEAPDLFPPSVYTLANYAFAHAVAQARATRLDGKLVLAPGIGECLRAAGGRGVNAQVETKTTGGLFGPKLSTLVLAATATAGADAPVAVAEAMSPGESLWAHGVLQSGRSGECELRLEVSGTDRLRADKEEVLGRAGLRTSQLWTLRSGAIDRQELLKFMRLVALEGTDAFILEAVFLPDVWPLHLDLPFSASNEAAACDGLARACEAALGQMCGSEAGDAAMAARGDGSRASKLATLRVGERAALRDTMRYVQQEKELNKGKEYYQERRLRELNLDRPVSEDEIVPG